MPNLLTTHQIREKYLSFFESKGHLRYPSDSIISPDPTLMFSVAGMQQFKPYFMGSTPSFGDKGIHYRVTTSQKCVRIGDIENVGRTNRHNSLFEMLGNFSFGDYFKKEAIVWGWEFLTSSEYLALEPERLYVTIYKDDDEAFGFWTQDVGLPADHIIRFDADENFWPADAPKKGPNGPCGPCSEIYYDRGPSYGSDTWEDYAQNPESSRYLEIWNLVFPQFDRQDGGVLANLPKPNIDTGMGLHRVAAICQDVRDFYDIDIFRPIIDAVSKLSGKAYEGETSVSHRVIADHIRTVSMSIADGVVLSNTGRGYVIRKVLRRASRHAYLLGFKEPVLHKLVSIVVDTMGAVFPELTDNQANIQNIIRLEEERFLKTLESGTERLDGLLSKLQNGDALEGREAFTLYDTYGFPLDLTEEIALEHGISVDKAGFDVALKEQQERARAASKYGKMELFGEVNTWIEELAKTHGETQFVGYESLEQSTQVLGIVSAGEAIGKLTGGGTAMVALETSPFYAEGGGQVGDAGSLEWNGGNATVLNTRKTPQGIFLHEVEVQHGALEVGTQVRALVSSQRQATERHHTATHLLHAALRSVLGTGVAQRGSLVTPERLRFDFSHNEPMTRAEIAEVELLVGRWIESDFAVSYQSLPIDQARAAGAMALFGEKYGDVVRMVSVEGGVQSETGLVSSKELCGGCHVTRVGEIGGFVIVAEEGTAAGVRRLEAVCGEAATQYVRQTLERVQQISSSLGSKPSELPERVAGLQGQIKDLNKEIETLKRKLTEAQMGGGGEGNSLREWNGFQLAIAQLEGVEAGALRGAADTLLEKSGADLVIVTSSGAVVVKASKEAVAKGAHAGNLIGKLAAAGGGKGGGRPDMAQAGVQDIGAALAALE
jgi:alanyl-tRNA synthetase